ncbi:DUF427 domain-containing protein [Streptomyces sp. MK7]|uniref:DUF427 domain-containing protein n=1 Tax=Streptomyces sp. MK7 TaxID=3067635 RepID=UPI0037DA54D3
MIASWRWGTGSAPQDYACHEDNDHGALHTGLPGNDRPGRPRRTGTAPHPRLYGEPSCLRHRAGALCVAVAGLPAVLHPSGRHPRRSSPRRGPDHGVAGGQGASPQPPAGCAHPPGRGLGMDRRRACRHLRPCQLPLGGHRRMVREGRAGLRPSSEPLHPRRRAPIRSQCPRAPRRSRARGRAVLGDGAGDRPPTRYYLDRLHIDWTRMEPPDTVTSCPYKGNTTLPSSSPIIFFHSTSEVAAWSIRSRRSEPQRLRRVPCRPSGRRMGTASVRYGTSGSAIGGRDGRRKLPAAPGSPVRRADGRRWRVDEAPVACGHSPPWAASHTTSRSWTRPGLHVLDRGRLWYRPQAAEAQSQSAHTARGARAEVAPRKPGMSRPRRGPRSMRGRWRPSPGDRRSAASMRPLGRRRP